MVLTGEEIKEYIKEGKLKIEPFDEKTIRENGIDLRLGDEFAMYSLENETIDLAELESTENLFVKNKAKDGKIVIPPKKFVLLSSLEYIKFPNDVVGFCNLRSTLARFGLSIPPTTISAGAEGNITLEVFNTTDNSIVLRSGMRFAYVILFKTDKETSYKGGYLGQKGVTLPKGLKNDL